MNWCVAIYKNTEAQCTAYCKNYYGTPGICNYMFCPKTGFAGPTCEKAGCQDPANCVLLWLSAGYANAGECASDFALRYAYGHWKP